jgi:hypothetical protein
VARWRTTMPIAMKTAAHNAKKMTSPCPIKSVLPPFWTLLHQLVLSSVRTAPAAYTVEVRSAGFEPSVRVCP